MTNKDFSNPLRLFLGRTVKVKVEKELEVEGRLLGYNLGNIKGKPHKPNVLVVESGSGKLIVRGNWLCVGILEVSS